MHLDHVVERDGVLRRSLRQRASLASKQHHNEQTAPQKGKFHCISS
jgi:hypothetical protein